MTLTQILQKIRNAFYTKKEIDSMGGGASLSDTISQKANKSDLSNYLPLTGGWLSGNINFRGDCYTYVGWDTELSSERYVVTTTSSKVGANLGAALYLYGGDFENSWGEKGNFRLVAQSKEKGSKYLLGTPSGSLTWNGKELATQEYVNTNLGSKANDANVVHKSGNENIDGIKNFTNSIVYSHLYTTDDSSYHIISGGAAWDSGGNIFLYGKNANTGAGHVVLTARSDAGVNIVEITPDVGVIPSTYNAQGISLGTSSNKWKDVNTTLLNGHEISALGVPLTYTISLEGNVQTRQLYAGVYLHYAVATENGWIQVREHGGSGGWRLMVYGTTLESTNGDPTLSSPQMNQYDFVSLPVRKGSYFGIVSSNENANYTFRLTVNSK